MCVIVLKFKGADFPSKRTIKACIEENPHGFAMAWNENGQLRTFRTMDADEIMSKYDEVRHLDPAATGLVFHARIATHGSKSLANCHCWTNDEGNLAFAHNGILSNVGSRGDLTDSETFFRDIFLPVYDGAGKRVAMEVARITALATNSRLALIDEKGDISPVGAYSKECEEGHRGMVYFSNMNWKRRMFTQWPFDRRPASKKPAPVPRRGSVVSTLDEDGRITSVTVKDLLAKDDIPYWSPSGSLFDMP